MHMAIFNLANRIAANFKIPLIVWGENSAKEYGYKEESDLNKKSLDKKWIKNYGVTNSTLAEDWADNSIKVKDLFLYSDKINNNFKPYSIFLADYFNWDPIKASIKLRSLVLKKQNIQKLVYMILQI